MDDKSIDLIATDPPFNTGRNRSNSAGSYEDNWKWLKDGETPPDQWSWESAVHERWLEEVQDDNEPLYHAIEAIRRSHSDGMAAFICFLSVRLLEMHRILKPTGSIFLHCDSTANAYIRMAMDAIFGRNNLVNEVIWRKYAGRKNNAKHKLSTQHDTIFFYRKSSKSVFYPVFVPHSKEEIAKKYKYTDDDGRPYRLSWGGSYQRTGVNKRLYLDESPGRAIGTLWVEDGLQLNTSSSEATKSPDQKPLALYERIIKLATKEGDWVLDPFCGCATTPIAAEKLKRNWVGIDRRTDAEPHILNRLLFTEGRADDQQFIPQIDGEFDPVRLQQARDTIADMGFICTDEVPKRSKPGANAPHLEQVGGRVVRRRNRYSYNEMKNILIKLFDYQCWGCDFVAEDTRSHPAERFLELDHVNPVSSGGSNEITNRALLCRPCNGAKSDTSTLTVLRRAAGYTTGKRQRGDEHPIDLELASIMIEDYVARDVQQSVLAKSA